MKRMIMNFKKVMRRVAKFYIEAMSQYGEALSNSRGLSAC